MKFKIYFIVFFLLLIKTVNAQTSWPSINWNEATNLTPVMDVAGIKEASGLYWNLLTERLYVVLNDGRVRILQYYSTANSFSQLASKSISGGPEGITMVNNSENAFYVIDENNYQIIKYTNTPNFSTVTASTSWNLLTAPSPMTDTGNTGPEGICFIPDSALIRAEFISQVTGLPYTSQKGMGGLFFIANQDQGYIWVFDLNPTVSNDFLYIGKYQTNRSESCDLSFDNSTGLLYILHNVDGNRLEVTDLSSAINGSQRKFNMVNEYYLPVPTSNTNIEGFAISNKCSATNTVSAWLCRDASSSDSTTVLTDVLRWFFPFVSDGDCALGNETFEMDKLKIYPNPVGNILQIQATDFMVTKLEIYNILGEKIITQSESTTTMDISNLKQGLYFLFLSNENDTFKTTFIKK